MLDVRRLRVLHAVSAYGSVTAAAAALGYSAPAVSQQLAALERETGMKKVCAMLVLLGALLSMTGCNTAHGVGQDVENAGDAIKDATN